MNEELCHILCEHLPPKELIQMTVSKDMRNHLYNFHQRKLLQILRKAIEGKQLTIFQLLTDYINDGYYDENEQGCAIQHMREFSQNELAKVSVNNLLSETITNINEFTEKQTQLQDYEKFILQRHTSYIYDMTLNYQIHSNI